MFLCQSAYADLGLAFFALLAVFAVFRWLEPGLRQWIVAGRRLLGSEPGAKYMGAARRREPGDRVVLAWAPPANDAAILVDPASTARVTALVFAPWIIKNWVMSGNPLSPALANLIPTRGFSSPDYDRLVQLTRTWHGYPGGLLDWILIPGGRPFVPTSFTAVRDLPTWLSFRSRSFSPGGIAGSGSWLFAWPLDTDSAARHCDDALLCPGFPLDQHRDCRARSGREQEANRVGAGKSCVVCRLALIAMKLPWFAGLWRNTGAAGSRYGQIQSVRFLTRTRAVFGSEGFRPGRKSTLQVSRHPALKAPASSPLRLFIRRLTDHEVFMPPNSTPSSQMADAAIELARNGTGVFNIELNILRPNLSCRFWKIRMTGSRPFTPDELHPRLFYIENGIPMEISPWSVRPSESTGAAREVLVDLGAASKVERITVNRGPIIVADYRVFGSPGSSEDKWQEVPIRRAFPGLINSPLGILLLSPRRTAAARPADRESDHRRRARPPSWCRIPDGVFRETTRVCSS